MYSPFNFKELYDEAFKAVKARNSVAEWEAFGYGDIEAWKDDFKKGQLDLYWLCTALLDLALVEKTHRPITDDFFVRKNPYQEAKDWTVTVSKQSTIKNRLLLYPRGSFKSTIDRADAIQWMLCFPQIRVVYMTAEDTLATEFVAETRKHFEIADDHKLSRFQMLYFAHCIPAKTKEDESQFTSRSKVDKKQPSVRALSLGASTVGKHAEIGKFDDCVSNKNSGPTANIDQRKKVSEEIILARSIVDKLGFWDYVGTNYNEDDAYTILQDKIPELKVLKSSAWTVKPHAMKKNIPELLPEDVDLLFPEDGNGAPRITFKDIMTEYLLDPYICSCQLFLDPQKAKTAKFSEQMLRRQIIPHEQFPQAGEYFTASCWDFAKTDNASSDRSCGIVALFTTSGPSAGRMFVTEIVRGRFSRSDLPYEVARQATRWKPLEYLGIEKSPGADFLSNDITRALTQVGYPDAPSIDWIPVENVKGAKNSRALGLEILFIDNRIFFSDQIPKELMDAVIREFVNFKGDSNRKDDAVDACARLSKYIRTDIKPPQTEQEKMNAAWDLLAQKQEYEKQFGYRDPEQPGRPETPGIWKIDGYDRPKELEPQPMTHYEGIPIRPPNEDPYLGPIGN